MTPPTCAMSKARVQDEDRSARAHILKEICNEYQELNGPYIETLNEPPSSLEFLRITRIARPVLIRGVQVPALHRWSTDYLCEMMGERPISVAVTPDGNADAIVPGEDGKYYFTIPHVESISMEDLISKLEECVETSTSQDVYYLQSQNGNLYNSSIETDEFLPLRKDVEKDISWATEAFDSSPDAVNIWMGNERSVTSIHSDPYENIYTVVRGAKHFTLLPPTEGWCLRERLYPHARYVRRESGALTLVPSDSSISPVRWSSIRNPGDEAELPPEAHPINITVQAGETLYLPAGWWHYVRQTGLTIALNWWYDTELRGMNWVWMSFLRGPSDAVPDGNEENGVLIRTV